MTRGRFWLGAAGVIGGVGWTAWIAIGKPASVLSPTTYVLSLMVPVLAAAVVAPLLVGPVATLLMWPFMRSAGPTAMLVRESVLTSHQHCRHRGARAAHRRSGLLTARRHRLARCGT